MNSVIIRKKRWIFFDSLYISRPYRGNAIFSLALSEFSLKFLTEYSEYSEYTEYSEILK